MTDISLIQTVPTLTQFLILILLTSQLCCFQVIHKLNVAPVILAMLCLLTTLSLNLAPYNASENIRAFLSNLALFCSVPLFIIFCHLLFPMYRSKASETAFFCLSLFFVSLGITLELSQQSNTLTTLEITHAQLLVPYLIIVAVGFLYCTNLTFQAVYHKRANAKFFLIALLCLPIGSMIELFRPELSSVMSWSIILFLCLNSGVLWSRYAHQLKHAEKINMHMKERIEHLKRKTERKDDLLAEASHALKLPMHGIEVLSSQLQENKEVLNQEIKDSLELIRSSSKQLTHMVNDILDYSSLKHQSLKLQFTTVELKPVIQQVTTSLSPLLSGRPIELSYEVSPPSIKVIADAARLNQILFNLIGNAIKFTKQGSICVKVTAEDKNHVRVSVKDTGLGIDHQQASEIFKPYRQGIHETVDQSGHGLGLTITQQLIELHNSQLELKSIPGHGSTFSFTLEIANYLPDTVLNLVEGTEH